MSLVAQILPAGVWGAEIRDTGQAVPLHPGEEAAVARAGDKRRRDFALGRSCARAALAQAGLFDAVIGRTPHGAPDWPQGFCGSITHTTGYGAALAARLANFGGVGLDAERIGGVTEALAPRLFDAREQQWLGVLAEESRAVMATVLFSAKEAHFKASAGHRTLRFQAVHIEVQGHALLARQAGLADMEGRYAVDGDLVVTAVWRR